MKEEKKIEEKASFEENTMRQRHYPSVKHWNKLTTKQQRKENQIKILFDWVLSVELDNICDFEFCDREFSCS